MYDSFASQLADLDLTGFTIAPAPFDATDFPSEDATAQTLGAVWSDLFALFADTALEADSEDIAWGLVNLFHRAASRKSAQLDRASDEIRVLLASADGSEIHSSNLEEQTARAQAAEASMQAFEQMREIAASLYRDETGSSWKAALPDVRLHDLRHSFASIAIANGIPLATIGKLLGHALPETTARYAHLADDIISESADRICSSLAGALGIAA